MVRVSAPRNGGAPYRSATGVMGRCGHGTHLQRRSRVARRVLPRIQHAGGPDNRRLPAMPATACLALETIQKTFDLARGLCRTGPGQRCSVRAMAESWPPLGYGSWSATCDTLHAHTQVLGKLAVALAPPEPQLQHAALWVSARGWETRPLPAPDGWGALVAALDLRAHEAVVEHSDGRSVQVSLTPDRPVGEVTRAVVGAAHALGGAVEID